MRYRITTRSTPGGAYYRAQYLWLRLFWRSCAYYQCRDSQGHLHTVDGSEWRTNKVSCTHQIEEMETMRWWRAAPRCTTTHEPFFIGAQKSLHE